MDDPAILKEHIRLLEARLKAESGELKFWQSQALAQGRDIAALQTEVKLLRREAIVDGPNWCACGRAKRWVNLCEKCENDE